MAEIIDGKYYIADLSFEKIDEHWKDESEDEVDELAAKAGKVLTIIGDGLTYADNTKEDKLYRFYEHSADSTSRIEFVAESLALLKHEWISFDDFEDHLRIQTSQKVRYTSSAVNGLLEGELDEDTEKLLTQVQKVTQTELARRGIE